MGLIMDPQGSGSPMSLKRLSMKSIWVKRRNGPVSLANFPLGLRRWLEGEKAKEQLQENTGGLSGLDLKVLEDIRKSSH